MLLNYCFGHVNSTVLLFPYGPLPTSTTFPRLRRRRHRRRSAAATVATTRGGGPPFANMGLPRSEKLMRTDNEGGGVDVDPRTLTPALLMEWSNPEVVVVVVGGPRNSYGRTTRRQGPTPIRAH